MHKGFLTYFILKLLSKQEMHGYELMVELKNITGWSVSPGSIYPKLRELELSGMIMGKELVSAGKFKKIYSITKRGNDMLVGLEQSVSKLTSLFDKLGIEKD